MNAVHSKTTIPNGGHDMNKNTSTVNVTGDIVHSKQDSLLFRTNLPINIYSIPLQCYSEHCDGFRQGWRENAMELV